MIPIDLALQTLDSFESEIPTLYPDTLLDYRGREITRQSVHLYLASEKRRFAEIASLLPNPDPHHHRLLDVGTAYGFLPALLKQHSPWQCEGLDVPENIKVYCRFAQKYGIQVHAGLLGTKPLHFPDKSFGAVVFSEVLEHLRLSPLMVFKELHRILAPGGYLLLTTPNMARLTHIIKLILGRNILEPFPNDVVTDNITEHLTHIREYTMDELLILLLQANFKPTQALYSACMDRKRPLFLLTALIPRWRGNLMILAQKV